MIIASSCLSRFNMLQKSCRSCLKQQLVQCSPGSEVCYKQLCAQVHGKITLKVEPLQNCANLQLVPAGLPYIYGYIQQVTGVLCQGFPVSKIAPDCDLLMFHEFH